MDADMWTEKPFKSRTVEQVAASNAWNCR